MTRYHSHRGDINKQEKIKDSLDPILKSQKDIKEGVLHLLRVLGIRDQVLIASRRAYQKLDKDCKKAVASTFRKLIIREREAAAARESVLMKLENAVNNINVEVDFEDFIMQHRQGEESSLQCCVQALTVLGSLQQQDSNTTDIIYHNRVSPEVSTTRGHQGARSSIFGLTLTNINLDREAFSIQTPLYMSRSNSHDTLSIATEDQSFMSSSMKVDYAFDKHKVKAKDRDGEKESRQLTAPTPVAPASTASATLSYAVTTGLPIAEAFATIVSLCTGEKRKVPEKEIENEDISTENISLHLSRIFYSNGLTNLGDDIAGDECKDRLIGYNECSPISAVAEHYSDYTINSSNQYENHDVNSISNRNDNMRTHPHLIQAADSARNVIEDLDFDTKLSTRTTIYNRSISLYEICNSDYNSPTKINSNTHFNKTMTSELNIEKGSLELAESTKPVFIGSNLDAKNSEIRMDCEMKDEEVVSERAVKRGDFKFGETIEYTISKSNSNSNKDENKNSLSTTSSIKENEMTSEENLNVVYEKNEIKTLIPTSISLELSSKYLSEIVKSQRGRNAFIIELNQFRSKKVLMIII